MFCLDIYLRLLSKAILDKRRGRGRVPMHEALGLPDAEKTVLAWGQKSFRIRPLLVDFAEARIKRADEFAQIYDQDEPGR